MRLDELFSKETDGFTPSPLQIDVDELVKQLQTNCGKMIAACKQSKHVLMRGIGAVQGKTDTLAWTAKIRTDRKSSVASQEEHEQISAAMAALNLPTRKETIACSAKYSVASQWGPVCVVFLKDGWKGVVFEHGDIEDVYVKADPILRRSGTDNLDALKKVVADFRPIRIQSSGDLASVMGGNHEEISLAGTSYWAIPVKMASEVMSKLGLGDIPLK